MKYTFSQFGGMLPRISPRLLPDQNAQFAQGTKLRSGALRPFNAPAQIAVYDEPASEYQTLYKYESGSDDLFLVFENDVDIARGPIANDQYNRSYMTGLDVPRVFDSSLVSDPATTVDSSNSYTIKIPVGSAASLAVSGTGTGEIVSRAYVYTYIREWPDTKFDEGAPSLPAQDGSGNNYIDVQIGETVTISDIEDAPNQSDNAVSKIAIYRAVTGSTDVQYQLVHEFGIDDVKNAPGGTLDGVTWVPGSQTFTYDDTKTDSELGDVLVSTTWVAPSDNLRGLISLRNGSLVAFEDNVVHFSEPYQPHAWPTEYQVTLDYDIIGLGAFGNTVVVMTEQYPFLLNAQDPSLVIPQPTQSTAPCLSKRGIVNYENTVYYPSADGLMAVSSGGIRNVTQSLFTHDEWLIYAPSTFESAIQDGRYFSYYTNEETNDSGFLIIDIEEGLGGVSTEAFGASAFYVDKRLDTLYFVSEDLGGWKLWEWEGLPSTRVMTWRSKILVSSIGPTNMVGCRVRADFLSEADIANLNQALEDIATQNPDDFDGAINEVTYNYFTFNGDVFDQVRNDYDIVPTLNIRYFVDGAEIHSQSVESNEPFKLPAGITGTEFEVEVTSNLTVHQVDIATSMTELR